MSLTVIVPDVAKGFVPAIHEAESFQSLITKVSGPSVKLSAKGVRLIKPIPLTMLKGLILTLPVKSTLAFTVPETVQNIVLLKVVAIADPDITFTTTVYGVPSFIVALFVL